jgi:hypothetical protein
LLTERTTFDDVGLLSWFVDDARCTATASPFDKIRCVEVDSIIAGPNELEYVCAELLRSRLDFQRHSSPSLAPPVGVARIPMLAAEGQNEVLPPDVAAFSLRLIAEERLRFRPTSGHI